MKRGPASGISKYGVKKQLRTLREQVAIALNVSDEYLELAFEYYARHLDVETQHEKNVAELFWLKKELESRKRASSERSRPQSRERARA